MTEVEASLFEENQRLKQSKGKLCSTLDYWKEQAVYFQAERDYYRELSQEEKP